MSVYTFRDNNKIFITREGFTAIDTANTRNLELITIGELVDYAKFNIVDIEFDTNNVWVQMDGFGFGDAELCYGIDELIDYMLRDIKNTPFVSNNINQLRGNITHNIIILNKDDKALLNKVGKELNRANSTESQGYRKELYFLDYWDVVYLVDTSMRDRQHLEDNPNCIFKYTLDKLVRDILDQKVRVVNLEKLTGKLPIWSTKQLIDAEEDEEEFGKHITNLANQLNFTVLSRGYNGLGTEMAFVEEPDGSKHWYTEHQLNNMIKQKG